MLHDLLITLIFTARSYHQSKWCQCKYYGLYQCILYCMLKDGKQAAAAHELFYMTSLVTQNRADLGKIYYCWT
jgi:hypothetical protein